MKRKTILLALASVLAIGCGGKSEITYRADQNVVKYGIVHSQYIGEFTAKTDSKGKLTVAKFDEIFLPQDWSQLSSIEDLPSGLDATDFHQVVHAKSASRAAETGYFAKKVLVNDEVYTLDVSVFEGLEIVAGTGSDTTPRKLIPNFAILPLYVNGNDILTTATIAGKVSLYKDVAFLKEYVENYDVAFKKSGTATATPKMGILNAAEDLIVDANGNAAAIGNYVGRKTEDIYWKSDSYPLGWIGNIALLEEHIFEHGFEGLADAKLVDSKWVVTVDGKEIATGATIQDYADYVALAVAAYNDIKLPEAE